MSRVGRAGDRRFTARSYLTTSAAETVDDV